MLGLDYNLHNFSHLDYDILAAHNKLSDVIYGIYRIKIPAVSARSLKQLSQLPSENKPKILNQFNDILSMEELSTVNFTEKQLLVSFLEKTNQYVDDEFWKSYSEEQIVEIYSNEMTQTYRSFNFFKYTGYSLLDLSTFDWQLLFERPKAVVDQMQSYVIKALQGINGVMSIDIPEHILKENFISGLTEEFRTNASLVKFNNIGTVRDCDTSLPTGLIVTSTARSVNNLVDNLEKISFI